MGGDVDVAAVAVPKCSRRWHGRALTIADEGRSGLRSMFGVDLDG
jgi:hypothetical protein